MGARSCKCKYGNYLDWTVLFGTVYTYFFVMAKPFRILAVNPGSTSTKISCFDDESVLLDKTLRHSADELEQYATINSQLPLRKRAILEALGEADIPLDSLDAVVGRGGLIRPVAGGTYRVDGKMLADLEHGVLGEHASNLGGILAREIAPPSIEAYIVDPVVVDELEPIARYSGSTLFERSSIFHALNQKAIARRAATDMKTRYDVVDLVVVHLGGGISVGLHRNGRVIDVNDALNGDGPFSPERTGGLPALKIVDLCFSGEMDKTRIKRRIKGGGGLVDYLGTNDGREIGRRIDNGDRIAEEVYRAMAYQVSKEIGAMCAALGHAPDAIILTGGMAHDSRFTGWIEERVSFIAPVKIYPGEDEMMALVVGALRVLRGEEKVKEYEG